MKFHLSKRMRLLFTLFLISSTLFAKDFTFKCENKDIPLSAKGTYTYTSYGDLIYTNPENKKTNLNNILPLPDKIKDTDVTEKKIFIDAANTYNNQSYAFDRHGKLYFLSTLSYSNFDKNNPYADYKTKTLELFVNVFDPIDNTVKSVDEDMIGAIPQNICLTKDGKWIYVYATHCKDDGRGGTSGIGYGFLHITSTDFKFSKIKFFNTPDRHTFKTENSYIVSLCSNSDRMYFSYFDKEKKINRLYECIPPEPGSNTNKPVVGYVDIPFTSELNLTANEEGIWGVTKGNNANTAQLIKVIDRDGNYLMTDKSFNSDIQIKGYHLVRPNVVTGDSYLLYIPEEDGKIYKYEDDKIYDVTKSIAKKDKYTADDLLEVKEKILSEEFLKYENVVTENNLPDIVKTNKILFIIIAILTVIICGLIIALIQISIHTNKIKKNKKFIFSIQEAERGKISRDIHDSIIQDIRSIRIESELLNVASESEERKNKIISIATDCVVKLRNICYNLTPAELATHSEGDSSKIELVSMIQTLVIQFIERTHVPCQLKIDEHFDYPVLEKDISQNLFRIIQEALNNIEKHSYATSCQILIKNKIEEEKKYMLIYISDDGVGCDVNQMLKLKKRLHFGVRNMFDRASLIGATIDFQSEPGHGLEVRIKI